MTSTRPAGLPRVVYFGSSEIKYSLTERPRRDLAITVHPDLRVTVVSPPGRSLEKVDARVRARAPWIFRQQLRFRDLHPLPTPKRYVAGETHRYLGRQYRLRVVASSLESVRIERPFLVVSTKDRSNRSIRRLLDTWYRGRADELLEAYFDIFVNRNPMFKALVRGVRVRRMERRWGSCSPNGVITLNPMLIHCSPAGIEYVIAHELCHRRVMNHGAAFEHLLTRLMPDWASRKERLNRLGC